MQSRYTSGARRSAHALASHGSRREQRSAAYGASAKSAGAGDYSNSSSLLSVKLRTIGQEPDRTLTEADVTAGGGAAAVYVWGTRISVAHVQTTFKRFLAQFRASDAQLDEDERLRENSERDATAAQPTYVQLLSEVHDGRLRLQTTS